MAERLTMFALGEKAHFVLSGILPKYGSFFSKVVVGRDSGVADDFADQIIDVCKFYGVQYIERPEFRDECLDDDEYFIAIGWRWLISAPNDRLVVLHDSLLPKYRGFAPLVNCLVNGETEIGVTALFGAKEYDRGEIIYQKEIFITYPIKIHDALKKISFLYLEVASLIIHDIVDGKKLSGTPQVEVNATYSLWRDSDDYFIDWNGNANDIARFIDAVGYPYDGAKAHLNGNTVKVNAVEIMPDVTIENRSISVGKVIFLDNGKPVVICGSGLLKIVDSSSMAGDPILPLSKFRSRFS